MADLTALGMHWGFIKMPVTAETISLGLPVEIDRDRSRAKETVERGRRRDDTSVADESRGLQRRARFAEPEHAVAVADHGEPRLSRNRHRR